MRYVIFLPVLIFSMFYCLGLTAEEKNFMGPLGLIDEQPWQKSWVQKDSGDWSLFLLKGAGVCDSRDL